MYLTHIATYYFPLYMFIYFLSHKVMEHKFLFANIINSFEDFLKIHDDSSKFGKTIPHFSAINMLKKC